jgi:uncharacterized protein (TIGR02246 family)
VRLSVTRVLVVACLFLTLSACGGKPDVAAASGSSKQADEAAIRALLGNIQSTFNAGNLDEFMPVFADDAVISSQGSPDVVGAPAIRAMYEAALNQMGIQVSFDTQELEVFGDVAYERGTFVLKLSEKGTGKALAEVQNRHIHMFRRQADGQWKTWRMFANSAEAIPAGPPPGAPPAPAAAQ